MAPEISNDSEREVWDMSKSLQDQIKGHHGRSLKIFQQAFYMQPKEFDMLSRLRGIFGFTLVLHWVRLA